MTSSLDPVQSMTHYFKQYQVRLQSSVNKFQLQLNAASFVAKNPAFQEEMDKCHHAYRKALAENIPLTQKLIEVVGALIPLCPRIKSLNSSEFQQFCTLAAQFEELKEKRLKSEAETCSLYQKSIEILL